VPINLDQTTQAFLGLNAQWGVEQYLFGCQANDLEHSRKSDKVPADGFGQPVKNSLPGQQEASLKVKGMAVLDRGQINWQMHQWAGRKSPVNAWFALEGLQALQPATFQPSTIMDHSVTAKLKDPVDVTWELDARGAYYDGTILLSPQTLLTGPSGTGSLDLNPLNGITGATPTATTTGGAVALHVWAFDGGTAPTVTVTVQHSPDGVTYTNLAVFNTFSTLGSQLIKLPNPTTINPYVQAIWTATGTPTDVQVLCMFARTPNLSL